MKVVFSCFKTYSTLNFQGVLSDLSFTFTFTLKKKDTPKNVRSIFIFPWGEQYTQLIILTPGRYFYPPGNHQEKKNCRSYGPLPRKDIYIVNELTNETKKKDNGRACSV
jgi:hypothetical protein